MIDQEIYELASTVIGSIQSDLSEGVYAKLGGSLTLSWSTDPKVLAWAESLSTPDSPPQHRIVICYELARQLYRDAEDYYRFAETEFLEDRFQVAFQEFDPKPRLPDHFHRESGIRNMFVGALTWIFFHEIGHLMQEHGFIRAKFGETDPIARIEDCESDGSEELEGRPAVISHVTEIAADVEATAWCMIELVRHFLSAEGESSEQSLLDFSGTLYLLVCGISCAFYRFYGQRPVAPEAIAKGSHPSPIRRLEVCLPNIFEKLDDGGRGEKTHGLSRRKLVYLCLGASYSAGFFWISRYMPKPDFSPDELIPKGLLQDPFRNSYWGSILDAWDEIEPTVQSVRRFGIRFGILSFTHEFRSKLLEPTTHTLEQLPD